MATHQQVPDQQPNWGPYPPQGGYPYPPQGGYPYPPQPPKRRRRWPWVLLAVVALLIVIISTSKGGSNSASPTSSTSAPATSYTYKVTGSGSAMVGYMGKGGQMSESTQSLPYTVVVPRDQFMSLGEVSATQTSGSGTLSCSITDETGKVVGQNSSSGGQYSSVSCSSNGS